MKRILWLLTLVSLALTGPAIAADNVTVKDAAGATVTTASKDVSGTQFRKDICVTLADTTIDCFTELNAAILPEDTASANADSGMPVWAVRKATPANTSGTDGDYEALQISAGRLWTDAGALLPTSLGAKTGAASLSVVAASDGFAVNATQTGTWTVNLSSLNGAATAAKQPALGTAGTASTDVISVQGIASGTNLNVACQSGCSGGTQYAEDAVAASGNTGTVALGVQVASPASTAADGDWTWNQYTNGKLHVLDLSTNAVLGTTADAAWASGSGTAISLLKTIAGASIDTTPLSVKTDQTTHGTTDLVANDQTKIGGVTISTGNGVVGTGVQRVAIASDNTAFSVNLGTISTAATAAKQPALGTAGTASTDVISVQGIASGTNLNVNCAAGCSGGTQYAEDAVAANGNTGTVALAVQTASPADTAADGDWGWLQMKNGRLYTDSLAAQSGTWNITNVSGTVSLPTGAATAAKQPALGTAGSASTDVISIQGIASGTPVYQIGYAGTATTTFNRPADTNAYTANDWISDSTSAPTSGGFTFSNMCRISGGSGILTDLIVGSNDTTALAGKLYVFDASVTAINDNATDASTGISDSDMAKEVAEIPFTLAGRQNNATAHVQGLNIAYTCSGTANLRFLVQATGGTLTTTSANTYTFRAKFVTTN